MKFGGLLFVIVLFLLITIFSADVYAQGTCFCPNSGSCVATVDECIDVVNNCDTGYKAVFTCSTTVPNTCERPPGEPPEVLCGGSCTCEPVCVEFGFDCGNDDDCCGT